LIPFKSLLAARTGDAPGVLLQPAGQFMKALFDAAGNRSNLPRDDQRAVVALLP
jgi:hypothetical protein